MSRHRKKVRVAVKPRVVPRKIVRAQAIGEGMGHVGSTDEDVMCAQKGIAAGLLAEVIVYGLGADGHVRDQMSFNLSADQDGEIELDLPEGRSALEALDGALSRSVQHVAERFRRRGLQVSTRFRFHDAVTADPQRLTQARELLGTTACEAPQYRAGYRAQQTLSIVPAKDRGFGLTLIEEFFGDREE